MTSVLLAKAKAVAVESKVSSLESAFTSIETLTKQEALDLAGGLVDDISKNSFRLGGVFSLIQQNGWYSDAGYQSFREYIESEYGMKYRKAMYLIQIYHTLMEKDIQWESVSHLGWTKLVELIPVLNQDNLDHWVGLAEKSTVLQLRDLVQASMSTGTPSEDTPPATITSAVTTLTFKVHPDQKESIRLALDSAKEVMGTEYDTVALDMICQQYLGNGGPVVKAMSLEDVMKQSTWEDVLQTFEKLWPDVTVEVTIS